MKISVIIPCYNTEKYVAEAVDSVLSQEGVDVEVIAVDDGSSDGTLEILKSYGDRITVVPCEHVNGNHARNRGAELAKGDFLMFLDSDDFIGPGTLKALSENCDPNEPILRFCPCKYYLQDKKGEWIVGKPHTKRFHPPSGDVLRDYVGLKWGIITCGVLLTRAAYELTGGWDETVLAHQEMLLFITAMVKGAKGQAVEGVLGYYRKRNDPKSPSIVQTKTRKVLESRFNAMQKIFQLLENTPVFEHFKPAYGNYCWGLAKLASHCKFYDLSEKCIDLGKKYGDNDLPTESRVLSVISKIFGVSAALGASRLARKFIKPKKPIFTEAMKK